MGLKLLQGSTSSPDNAASLVERVICGFHKEGDCVATAIDTARRCPFSISAESSVRSMRFGVTSLSRPLRFPGFFGASVTCPSPGPRMSVSLALFHLHASSGT